MLAEYMLGELTGETQIQAFFMDAVATGALCVDQGTIARSNGDIGERLRNLRRDKGVSLKKLSKNIGIHSGSLSKLERGLNGFNVRTLSLYADSLGLSRYDLLKESGYLIIRQENIKGYDPVKFEEAVRILVDTKAINFQ